MQHDYKRWLESQGYDSGTINAQVHRVRRVEEFLGNLDEHFNNDSFDSLLSKLRYSTEDERRGRPNPTSIPINGVLRTNLASYRDAVSRYQKYLEGSTIVRRSSPYALNSVRPPELLASADSIFTQLKSQFPADLRASAKSMSQHYEVFFMLENEARRIVEKTMEKRYGPDWWDRVSEQIRDACKRNRQRELEAGVTSRSDSNLDYITFGEINQIIESHWKSFEGVMANQKAIKTLLTSLNTLRSVIAHCGVLADDEVDRLSLAVRDWFRLVKRGE